jgi:hypothetical protein
MAVYYASKAFVQSFSEALHEELRGKGVSVTNLCPGPTETNFSKTARSHRDRETQTTKMSAQAVAFVGHRDFRHGNCVSIPGFSNKLVSLAPKFLPRSVVRNLVGKYDRLK